MNKIIFFVIPLVFLFHNAYADVFIENDQQYIDDDQLLHIVGEITNYSDKPINQIEISATALSNDNHEIETIHTNIPSHTIMPGMKAGFDILFPKSELYSAYMILIENNYNGPFINQSQKEVFNYCKKRHHLPPLVGKSNISIELHHRITRPIDFIECPLSENILKNKKILNFYDQEIFIPSIDDLILHLLVHFSLNSEISNELKIVSDIKILEKKYSIDWIKFYDKINNRKILKSSALSLAIIKNHFEPKRDLKNLEKVFRNINLTDEITLIAFQKMISQNNELVSSKSFYEISRKDSLRNFKQFFKKIFLNKYDIINYYKISNPNFLNLFFFRIINTFDRLKKYFPFILRFFLIKDKNTKKLNEYRKIQEWLN